MNLDASAAGLLSHLGKQADDVIEQGTSWIELGSEFNVGLYDRDDPYPDWHDATPFEPMFLAILWAKTENDSVTGLADRLQAQPKIATAFGFDPDDIPHGDTFARAWRERFGDDDADRDLQATIERAAAQIDEIATARGSPIGGHTGLNPEETSGTSKRTEQRLLRKKTRDVMDQMGDVVYPALDFPRPEKAIYDEGDLLELQTVLGINGVAAHEGASINGDRLSEIRDPDPDDPFYVDGLTGETLLESVHELGVEDVTTMINQGARRALSRIKPYAEFPEPVFLAIDATYVGYYGERDGLDWVASAPPNKEYDWCHKFATATLVGDGVHMVVGTIPISNAEARETDAYPGTDRSYRVGEVVRDLLSIVADQITVRCVYADREFAAADVILALEEQRMKYVIPVPRNKRLKRWLDRNVSDGIVAVEDDWGVYGPVKHGSSRERVETTVVGLPGDPDDDQYGFGNSDDEQPADGETEPVPFYTNKPVDDELGIDRRRTRLEIERYSRRGGIETSYAKIKEFAPTTTSKDFTVRLWHFGFAVLLYNIWLLVDFLVQVGLDVEFRSKPRITSQRFIRYVRNRLDRLI